MQILNKKTQLLLLPKYNKSHKFTAYLMYLCYFFSYLYKYLNRYRANQLDIFITTSTKRATFIATKYIIWHTTISKIGHPSLSKDFKGPIQINRGKCYSSMLLCLKINCINIKATKTKSLLSASKTTWSSFPIISARDFTVCNLHSCYHNGRVFIC